MKKLLLIATASAAILSSAATFADEEFYVKANLGAAIFDKQRDKPTGLKMKSDTAFIGEVGVGYYVMDNLRADITLAMNANPQMKKSGTLNNQFNGLVGSIKHKGTVNSLMINGYVDVFDVSMAKFFIGAGVGSSYLKEKITTTLNNTSFGTSTKKKYDFAWQASLGVSTEVAPDVKAELVYSYRGYGKTKAKNVDIAGIGAVSEGGTKYQGNNLMAGIRFDI